MEIYRFLSLLNISNLKYGVENSPIYKNINKFVEDTASYQDEFESIKTNLILAYPKKLLFKSICTFGYGKKLEFYITVIPDFSTGFKVTVKGSRCEEKGSTHDFFYDYMRRSINSFPDYQDKFFYFTCGFWIDRKSKIENIEDKIKIFHSPTGFLNYDYRGKYRSKSFDIDLNELAQCTYNDFICERCGAVNYTIAFDEYSQNLKGCSNPYCTGYLIKTNPYTGIYSIYYNGVNIFDYNPDKKDEAINPDCKKYRIINPYCEDIILHISPYTEYFMETLIMNQNLNWLDNLNKAVEG